MYVRERERRIHVRRLKYLDPPNCDAWSVVFGLRRSSFISRAGSNSKANDERSACVYGTAYAARAVGVKAARMRHDPPHGHAHGTQDQDARERAPSEDHGRGRFVMRLPVRVSLVN